MRLRPVPSIADIYLDSFAIDDEHAGVDWSRFAYVQYVTNVDYLCNSVMLFERLHTLGTKADKLMMYPGFFTPGDKSLQGQLLAKARDEYGVKLAPIDVLRRTSKDGNTFNPFHQTLLTLGSSYLGGEFHKAAGVQSNTI